MNSEEAFRNYWKMHWRAMLARAMGSHCHDKEEASLYRAYVTIKKAEIQRRELGPDRPGPTIR